MDQLNASFAPVPTDRSRTIADDLKGLLATYGRHAWVFWYSFAIVCLLGMMWLTFATPIYTATATVALDRRSTDVVNMQAVLSGLPSDSASVDTEVEVLQSRSLLARVVDALKLQNDPEFNTDSPPHLAAAAERLLLQGWNGVTRVFVKAPRAAAPARSASTLRNAQAADALREKIIDHLSDNLTVIREGLTYAMFVDYNDKNPQQAARIANGIAQQYIEQQLDSKDQATRTANQWLRQRINELRQEVEAADAAVEAYRSKEGILVAKGATINESALSDAASQLTTARAQLADAQARLSSFRSQMNNGGAASAGQSGISGVLDQLRLKYADLQQQKVQLAATLGPQHPQMIQVNQQLENVKGQIDAEENRISNALSSEVAAARQKMRSLQDSQSEAQGHLAQEGKSQVHLAELQRNADAVRSLYESFLERYKQTDAQQSLARPDARILSEATAPGTPSFPKKKLMFGVTLLAAFVVASALVFLFELFRSVVIFPEDLERRTQLPALGMVPLLRRKDLYAKGKRIRATDLVVRKPMSVFTEAFRTLRVEILSSSNGRRGQVVQMTSGTLGEGKTLCSIAFGRTLAMDGLNVLIIDGDVRRRVLTDNMRITRGPGLVQVLTGEADLEDAIMPGGRNAPSILPLANEEAVPLDLFSSERFETLLDNLRDRYHVVIIDSPPVLAIADALVLAKLSDIVVLIAKWGHTPQQAVMKALGQLQKVGANVAGVLLTHVDLKTMAGHTFGRGYHTSMMKYYVEN